MRGKASSFASYYFPLVILRSAFCADSFARSREHTPSEGEIKESRQLLQLITDLAAIVFWLVSSKSSGAPLGKMRGLITVKLANEQVNYGAKFLYKKCHFSERRSSSCTESLKQAVGEDGVEQEENHRTNRFLHFCFKKRLWFPQLWAQKHTIWAWEETLVSLSFLVFFSRNFFRLPFPLTQETASAPSFTPAFYPVSHFHLYTSVEPLGCLRFFLGSFSFSVLQPTCTKRNFWVITLSLQGRLHTWKWNSWVCLLEKSWKI